MANVRKRGKFWAAQIIRKGYKSLHRTFNTRAEAEAWSKDTESRMLRRTYRDNSESFKLTFAKALERYQKEVSAHKKGFKQEATRIARWREHHLAGRQLGSLTSDDFAAYRDEMRGAGKATNTIRLELALISHLFTVARKEWRMPALENPMAGIRMPAGSNPRDRRISESELKWILDAADQSALPAVLRLAVETAMRRSEIVTTLVWEQIDIEARVAHLPDTKGGVPRNVPLSAVAVALLDAIPGERKGRLFDVTPDAISRAFGRARKRARARYEAECTENGVESDPKFLVNVRFHDSRHEATSSLFEKGLDIMEAAAVTGHKDLKTLKRYTHLKASKIAAKIDASDVSTDTPTAVFHPGVKLQDYLPSSTAVIAAAKKTGIPVAELREIVACRARIDVGTAVRLEQLGPRAEMWVELQAIYDLAQARLAQVAPKHSPKRRKAAA